MTKRAPAAGSAEEERTEKMPDGAVRTEEATETDPTGTAVEKNGQTEINRKEAGAEEITTGAVPKETADMPCCALKPRKAGKKIPVSYNISSSPCSFSHRRNVR